MSTMDRQPTGSIWLQATISGPLRDWWPAFEPSDSAWKLSPSAETLDLLPQACCPMMRKTWETHA